MKASVHSKNIPVFKAVIIHTNPDELVHNKPIIGGYGKYLIREILDDTWDGFDEDLHAVGSYIVWEISQSDSKYDFTDEGHGIMTGHAETITKLGLKQGTKRKRNPDNWQKNKKKKEYRTGKGKCVKAGCNEKCPFKCSVVLTIDDRK